MPRGNDMTKTTMHMRQEEFKNQRLLSENLKALRGLCGLSQLALADALGVTRQTVLMLENGKRPLTKTMFLALLFVFSQYPRGKQALMQLGIL